MVWRRITTRGKLLATTGGEPVGALSPPSSSLTATSRSWKSFLPYFKRVRILLLIRCCLCHTEIVTQSETFYADKSTVVGDVKQEVFPAFVSSAHGREGPIQASYNRYLSPHLVGIYDVSAAAPDFLPSLTSSVVSRVSTST